VAGLGRGARRRLRRVCFAGIAACYVLAVPWYRSGAAPPAIVAGLPDWVAVALGCYVVAGALNAVAWCLADVPDHAGAEEDAAS
jgi:hypothetical protein